MAWSRRHWHPDRQGDEHLPCPLPDGEIGSQLDDRSSGPDLPGGSHGGEFFDSVVLERLSVCWQAGRLWMQLPRKVPTPSSILIIMADSEVSIVVFLPRDRSGFSDNCMISATTPSSRILPISRPSGKQSPRTLRQMIWSSSIPVRWTPTLTDPELLWPR